MIEIHVRLHGILRDKLPAEAKGRIDLILPDHSTVRDVLEHFDTQHFVSFAVNEEIDLDDSHILTNGDLLEIFRVTAGG